jgi:hypothetical protein
MRVVDIDQGDAMARFGEQTAEQRTHRARTENPNVQSLKHRDAPR